MALLDTQKEFERISDATLGSISDFFPVVGKRKTLRLKRAWADDKLQAFDLKGQEKTKLSGKSWAVPLYADLELVDNKTNEVIDTRKKMLLARLPKLTPRLSYIVDGTEYQVNNQLRLKPGVYTRVQENGVLQSFFNLAKGYNFKMFMAPKTGKYTLQVGTTNVALYPVLKSLGLSDKEIQNRLGSDIYKANLTTKVEDEVNKLHTVLFGEKAESMAEASKNLKEYFSGTDLSNGTTSITHGRNYTKVTPPLLLDTASKMLEVNKGERSTDDRDALYFKELYTIDNLIDQRLKKNRQPILYRMAPRVDLKDKIDDILYDNKIRKAINGLFTTSDISDAISQTNPLEFVSNFTKTTIKGEGGIQSSHAIPESARSVHSSQFGFIDPVHTPESSEIGAIGHLTIGTHKQGGKMVTLLADKKTGKQIRVTPDDMRDVYISFPGEMVLKGGRYVSSKSKVHAFYNGEQVEVSPSKVRYVMSETKSMFGYAANMIPFLDSLEGARAMMGSKMQEQALPIVSREHPLVQSDMGDGDTFEAAVGDVVAVRSEASGEVTRVTKDSIHVRGGDGKTKKYDIYDNFPLNQKALLDSEPVVKVGDKVKNGQLLADTNFTKGGSLSLGTNLRVGYMNYKGYNFEDGVVISESAARKMTSTHLHKKTVQEETDGILNLKRFRAYYPNAITEAMSTKLDEDGVVKVGQRVEPGDVVIAYLSKKELTSEDIALGKLSKALAKPYKNQAVTWSESFPGEVVKVVKRGSIVEVYVRTAEAMGVGDKLAGRHGNKGTITLILPDGEMPQTSDGKALDIILNPHGIPSRINPSQILETAASKIAEKTGKPYVVKNFSKDDSARRVASDLKKAGLSDQEMVIDPASGKKLGKAFVGRQYIMKLDHPTRKKFSARNYGSYTIDMTPARGDKESGQSLDPLTFYAMIAHGAKKNLRDMATYKADYNPEFWRAIELGLPIPAPKTTFAFEKTLSMLNAMGVNVNKSGSEMKLMPMTDKEVLSMSNGQIKKSKFILSSKLSEEKGGLFDPYVTGGMMGEKWSHYTLAEEMPNPVYEEAIISIVPGLTKQKYNDVVAGRLHVDTSGVINSDGKGVTAGAGVRRLLEQINVRSEIGSLRKAIKTQKGSILNSSNKRLRFLMNLRDSKMEPTTFMIKHVPILPPRYRPIYPLPNGALETSTLNYLYRDLMLSSDAITKLADLPDADKAGNRENAYSALKALMGLGVSVTNPKHRGLLTEIKGTGSAKEGFFQKRVFRKRQDLSGRAIISPDPHLHVDEVGIPDKMLWKTHKPFIVRELVRLGYSPIKALEEIEKKTPAASRALDIAIKGRPVLLNRAPSLHKFSVMAFMPKRIGGESITIPPLVTGGFNADFDGDTMSVHVPVTTDAVEEAKGMLPSKNLFSTSKSLMLMPSQESQLGLWLFTQKGKRTSKKFRNAKEAIAAYDKGDIRFDDVVKVGTKQTTAGKLVINNILPDKLKDPDILLDKGKVRDILTSVARNDPKNAPALINKFKDIGYGISFDSGFSLKLNDFIVDHSERNKVFLDADKEIKRRTRGMSVKDAKDKKIEILMGADKKIGNIVKKTPVSNSLAAMVTAGSRGNWNQAKQILQAPVLYTDPEGRVVPDPVRHSFAEGLKPHEYWSSLYGARRGMIDRVKGTAGPGEFTKVLTASTINTIVTVIDCGTSEGIEVGVNDPKAMDRTLLKGISGVAPKNTVVTPSLVSRLKKKRIRNVTLRSTMTCRAQKGICQKCFGLDENGEFPSIGTNMGAISAQAMTEPTTQLTMKTFHSGGTASATGGITDSFSRINEIVMATKQIPGKGTLAEEDGQVKSITPGLVGGHNITIGQTEHFVPQHLDVTVKKGQKVNSGDLISTGKKHPLEVLRINGMLKARSDMVDELSDIYSSGGTPIDKRHIETVVKSVTNTTQILDPKGHGGFLEGDVVPHDEVLAINSKLSKEDKIIHAPIIRGAELTPYSRRDWLSQLAYRHLKDAVTLGAAQGWSTNVKGYNPIPAFVAGSIGTKEKQEGSF
jgi:DNA-directed RNA polymerase subunit beta'